MQLLRCSFVFVVSLAVVPACSSEPAPSTPSPSSAADRPVSAGSPSEATPLPAPEPCSRSAGTATGSVLAAPAIIVGDVTGDGRDDWLTLGYHGGVLVAGPLPGKTWACVPENGGTTYEAHSADLNGDGHLDLIVPQPWHSRVLVFFGPVAKDAALSAEAAPLVLRGMRDHEFGGLSDRFGGAVVIADVTGDGILDLVVSAPAEGEESCYGTRDTVVFEGPHVPGVRFADEAKTRITATERKCLGDFAYAGHDVDDDGKLDLVVSEDSLFRVFTLPLGVGTNAPTKTLETSRPHVPAHIGDGAGGKTLAFVRSGYDGFSVATPAAAPQKILWPEKRRGWLTSGRAGRLGSTPRTYVMTTPTGVLPNANGEVPVEIRALVASASSVEAMPFLANATFSVAGPASEGDLDGDGCIDVLVANVVLTCK